MGIAEDWALEADLRAGAKVKSVQLVNDAIQPGEWVERGIAAGPNHTRAEIEHPTPVLDRLRAAIADPNTEPADREAARKVLRISFHTKD